MLKHLKQVVKLSVKPTVRYAVIVSLFILFSSPVQARSTYAQIDKAIAQFINQQQFSFRNANVKITSLEKNLRLLACQRQIFVEFARGARQYGHSSLAVSCSYPEQWKIHVPVFIDGEVSSVVTRLPVARGTVLTREMLAMKPVSLSQTRNGYFPGVDDVIGMQSSRMIATGQILSPGVLKQRKWVKRGQSVNILAVSGKLTLSVRGTALADGKPGDVIRVRNLSSRRIIHGRVTGPSEVSINI